MNIEPQPTWTILDSSKLDDYDRCRRYFFFRHVLGWELDIPPHDTHFGESWHKGREYQLLHGYDDIAGAFAAFDAHYSLMFSQEDDAIYRPKTPTGALNGLMKFRDERARDLIDNKVVEIDGVKMTEISGTVPIDEKRVLHYRMDSIMERNEDGRIFSWDHKTTTEKYLIGERWANQFYLGIQNGTYTHCLYCMFPIDRVLGVEFCGTGFTYLLKSSAQRSQGYHASLRRVPAFKTPEQMNVWLWHVNVLADEIERDFDRLMHCTENDPILMAFRMTPHNCGDFKGCPFHDFCLSWPNPLVNAYEPPLGFKVEFWNPSEMKTTVRKNLEWK